MDNYIQSIEDLNFNEWNTPIKICIMENFGESVVYRGKIYNQLEWEISNEKKEYEFQNKYKPQYKNKELPSQIDPNYKQKQLMNEYKSLIDKALNKPIEKTVYIDNSIRTKISIF